MEIETDLKNSLYSGSRVTMGWLRKKRGRLLAYHTYLITVLVLCLAGLGVSAYLTVSHYRVHTDPGYQSFCAISKSINCDTVSQSQFAVWWGLPLAFWGVAAYSFILILVLFSTLPSAERRRAWTLSLVVACGGSLASIGFAIISAFIIETWCILCIATYGNNFFLVFLIWIIRRRFQLEPVGAALVKDLRFLWGNRRWSGPAFILFGVGLILSGLLFPAYWEIKPDGMLVDLPSGMTAEGYPWTGSENPQLEIMEFTDYQCFQCRKMHRHLIQLLTRYPGKIRLIHRHFPMDHEFNPIVNQRFHVGSGRMAILAVHAAFHGKFFEMNNWLFSMAGAEPGSIRLAEAAAATGLDAGKLSAAFQHTPYRLFLKRDIHEGLKLGIVGTPSYLINGRIYEGILPAEVLKPLMEVAPTD